MPFRNLVHTSRPVKTGCISILKEWRQKEETLVIAVKLQCSHLCAEGHVSEEHHTQMCLPLCLHRNWPTLKHIPQDSLVPTCHVTNSRIAWWTSCLLSPLVSACSQSEGWRDPTTSTPASLMDTGEFTGIISLLNVKHRDTQSRENSAKMIQDDITTAKTGFAEQVHF